MTATCKRCGTAFDAKSKRREFCDACRLAKRIEKAKAADGSQNNALLEERERRNLTVVEMAKLLGVHPSAYYNIEHNGVRPGRELRRRIADKLGQPAEKYFGPLIYNKTCRSCGLYYQTDNEKSKICPHCEEIRKQKTMPPIRRIQPSRGVQEIAAEARAAGMSYGQYVARKEGGAV